jgi:1-acyl-sn-glycerol-3-phosphate acyltransferase
MKKEWFFFPLGLLLRVIGGIPVDRKNNNSLTEQMVEEFRERDHFQLAIAPEGTRKKTNRWKTGFYFIALGAGVPISLAYIDYTKREVDISRNFLPTGNEKEDIEEIKGYYKDIEGKHPENFSAD